MPREAESARAAKDADFFAYSKTTNLGPGSRR